jgi:acetyl-CoA synthetase
VDDVINVSGHRIGTAEVESALVGHHLCAEAAVVPVDHPIKGQAIYAFVTLMNGIDYPPDESVRKELVAQVCGLRWRLRGWVVRRWKASGGRVSDGMQ